MNSDHFASSYVGSENHSLLKENVEEDIAAGKKAKILKLIFVSVCALSLIANGVLIYFLISKNNLAKNQAKDLERLTKDFRALNATITATNTNENANTNTNTNTSSTRRSTRSTTSESSTSESTDTSSSSSSQNNEEQEEVVVPPPPPSD